MFSHTLQIFGRLCDQNSLTLEPCWMHDCSEVKQALSSDIWGWQTCKHHMHWLWLLYLPLEAFSSLAISGGLSAADASRLYLPSLPHLTVFLCGWGIMVGNTELLLTFQLGFSSLCPRWGQRCIRSDRSFHHCPVSPGKLRACCVTTSNRELSCH